MKIYRKKVTPITEEIVNMLIRDRDIELEEGTKTEVIRDLGRILEEYIRQEFDISNEAKAILERENMPIENLNKVKASIAKQRGFVLEDEAMEILADKFIEYFYNEDPILEVYSDDQTIRKKFFTVMQKYLQVDQELDEEVRSKIKNISQDTPTWKIEYDRVMREVKRKKGLV